jgi:hypothetical protein
MSKQFINEVSRMKNLFDYKRGVVISEQVPNKFDPNGYYPSLGIGGGNKSKFTPKQIEAIKAGWPQAISDEFAKNLPVDKNGKIIPKKDEPVTKSEPTTKSVNKSVTKPVNKQTSTSKDTYMSPIELKQNVGNKTGVQAFQDWLDTTYSGWHKKYQKLNGEVNKGYGKFGLYTNDAWNEHKKEYLNKNPNLAADMKTDSTVPPTDVTGQASQTTQTAQQGQTAQPAQTAKAPQLANATPKNVDLSLAASITPEKYYEQLYKTGLIQGEPGGDNRIRYKGPELNAEQQALLTKAMENMEYEFYRKGNDNRLVYRKK